VNLVSRHDRAKQKVIEADIRKRMAVLPGARVSVGAGQTGENLKLVLAGEDPEALRLASQAVTSRATHAQGHR
jgi:hypothetical protein